MNDVVLPVRILGTGSLLPGRRWTTAEVLATLPEQRDVAEWERKTGIKSRYWTEPGTLAAPIAAETLGRALAAADLPATSLRRIIFVTSATPDMVTPATANKVAAALGLRGSCDAFDLRAGCMSFLSAFDVAARSVATGLGPVGVVSTELNSRGISPADHRPYLVFGDAAGAVVLGAARPGEGVLAIATGNDGSHPSDVLVEEPTLTGKREHVHFLKTGKELFDIAFAALRRGVEEVLDQAKVRLADIEWLLPHQPNGQMVDRMVEAMQLDRAKMIPVVEEIGSVTSASIPVSLDRLMRTRPVRPGDRILMAGVGAGIGWGAVLYRVGGA